MARIVALSSYVAYGHVGLKAMLPALERFGHEVIALPSVILSSHAAHPHVAGRPLDVTQLEAMVVAFERNGWLAGTDMVVTGYLPSAPHVEFAASLIGRVRNLSPDVTIICDPVLGDDPKGLYLPETAAVAIRALLLPLASFATPNAFELAWLSGMPVTSRATAADAARTLPCGKVLATSVPGGDGRLATTLIGPKTLAATSSVRRAAVPSGTGDVLTALFAAHLASGSAAEDALAASSGWLDHILALSGPADLNLAPLYGPSPAPAHIDLTTTRNA